MTFRKPLVLLFIAQKKSCEREHLLNRENDMKSNFADQRSEKMSKGESAQRKRSRKQPRGTDYRKLKVEIACKNVLITTFEHGNVQFSIERFKNYKIYINN